MKKLYFIILVIIAISCDPKNKDCDCIDIIGKRYYMSVGDSYKDECVYVDDPEYTNDGYVNLYRYSKTKSGEKMEKVLKYELLDNCIIRIYGKDQSKVLNENCSVISFSYLNALGNNPDVKLQLTSITCNQYQIGAVTHSDYDPR